MTPPGTEAINLLWFVLVAGLGTVGFFLFGALWIDRVAPWRGSLVSRRRFWFCIAYLVVFWALFCVLVFLLMSLPETAHAEVEAPSFAVADGNSWTKWITDGILAGMQQFWNNWLHTSGMMTLVNGLFTSIGWMAKSYLAGAQQVAGARCDIMNELSAGCVLDDPVVSAVITRSGQVFNALVGSGVVFLGFTTLLSFGGQAGKELGIVLPRLVIGVVAVNTSADLLRWVARIGKAIGQFLAGGSDDMGQVIQQQLSPEQAGGTLVILAAVMGLVVIQRVLLHGLFAVVAMTANLALACMVVPQWSSWFHRWLVLLGGLIVGAYLQTMLLHAGASMLARAVAESEDASKAGTAGAFAIGTLSAALVAPGLVGGAGLVGGSSFGLLRRLTRQQRLRAKHCPEDDQDEAPRAHAEETTTPSRKEEPTPVTTYQRLPPAPAAALPSPPAESEYTEFKPR